MFMELGMKLDNLIAAINNFIKNKHLGSFYYKWYLYFKLPGRIDEPNYYIFIDRLYKNKQLYRWQYEKLRSLKRKGV